MAVVGHNSRKQKKNGLHHPGREPHGCLHTGGEKRGHLAAPGRQTKWGGCCREGPLASDIGSFSHGQASRADTRSTRFHCILHKAASEVCYIVVFNNGSTTGSTDTPLGRIVGAQDWAISPLVLCGRGEGNRLPPYGSDP
jgi:hypothetical protein